MPSPRVRFFVSALLCLWIFATLDVVANAWQSENRGISFAKEFQHWRGEIGGLDKVIFKSSDDLKSLEGLEDGKEGRASKESDSSAKLRATILEKIGLAFEKLLHRNVVTDIQKDVERSEKSLDDFDLTNSPKRSPGSVN